ncbi:type II toxin-antitoxin system PemK/MazF family toxin [Marinilactibacillus sp. Marseille-P9653]|uniref:type II toxin-antitoxin system PemK/MazF family toxin n=1 Tax=Marinilactibacillus sp. Marseille-P9653 TaxID=2866583 RepID=UPI001CE3E565|nr:type II toxin-antitoxin system PemK/MazF family toxin [Marinilactibacillus sp. Marseille-P9653]
MRKDLKIKKLRSWSPRKEILSSNWEDLSDNAKNRYFRQGQVVMCELGENLGYEISNSRPVLIVSDSKFNSAGQVIVIPLTKNIRDHVRTHYTLKKEKYNFLTFDSCVKTEQVKSISTVRLKNVIGFVKTEDMTGVKARLKTIFAI